MRLEKEAKEFMEKKNNTTSKKLEEIFENVKLVQGLTDIILKKLKRDFFRLILDQIIETIC